MPDLMRHHHFKDDEIPADDGLSRLEARVVALLFETSVPDSRRDSSIAWELKHQAGVTQCARILAQRRGLDHKVAAAGALLHDIAAIVTGSYVDHARAGGPIAQQLLEEVGGFSEAEITQILKVVVDHSDKDLVSDDPWSEFGKDADILDCFLYPDAMDEYLLIKPWSKVFWYFKRAQAVWRELGLTPPASFHSLDEWRTESWLVALDAAADPADVEAVPFDSLPAPASPIVLYRTADGTPRVATTPANAEMLAAALGSTASSAAPTHGSTADAKFLWPALSGWQSVPGEQVAPMIQNAEENAS